MRQTVIYTRISSTSQDARSQEAELKRWAAAHEAKTPAKWFKDVFTGTTMTRPGWERPWKAVEAGEVGTIVVWRLDRIGRTARGLTALFDDLQRLGVNLVSLREGLDLATPAGRLLAHVLASVAQYETEVRSERQMAGIAAAKARGVRWGGSKKGRRIKVTDEQVATIRRLRQEKTPVAAIARATGLSRPTIYRWLEDASAPNGRP
jgi:DNA invertase Pin-like site-specific DNA recombinase